MATLAGHIELRHANGALAVAAVLLGWVVHEAEARSYTMDGFKPFS